MPHVHAHQPIEVRPSAPEPSDAGPDPDTVPAHIIAPLAHVERFLERALTGLGLTGSLRDASAYALLGGGKRLRPLLVMHAGAASGAPPEAMLASAASVEMIHAFSLVHDDLPALDNDVMRRGKPTLHVRHGEAMAILAGDGLMSTAFQLLTEHHEPALAGVLCRELAVGTTRMICGQVLDTLGGFEAAMPLPQRVAQIHRDKTGALIRASCRMGVIAGLGTSALGPAGKPDSQALQAITTYGESIGLMFQIVDDLVDVEQSADHAGKRTGKDIDAGKLTYPGVFGAAASRREVDRLREAARASLEVFGPAGEPLATICDYLAVRTK